MGSGQAMPKLDLGNASTGDPVQQEKYSAANAIEAIDRRAIRQAIMTQMLIEIAEQILASGVTITTYNDDGSIKRRGTLKERYEKEKDSTFVFLRDLIANPEVAFNTRRNKLFALDNPNDPTVTAPFGAINLVVFRCAMALGDGTSPVDIEEVAKRVVIRAGRSSGYGKRSKDYEDRGFAGCK